MEQIFGSKFSTAREHCLIRTQGTDCSHFFSPSASTFLKEIPTNLLPGRLMLFTAPLPRAKWVRRHGHGLMNNSPHLPLGATGTGVSGYGAV